MTVLGRRLTGRTLACALAAAALLALGFVLPVWRMDLQAPQYPNGLQLKAYGHQIEGDLRELNIINHYVGMQPLEPVPAPEMKLFRPGVLFLIVLALLAPLHRGLLRLASVLTVALPFGILVDLQWWLYRFGHDLDPTAPLRPEPFTPLALGASKIANFISHASVSGGWWCLLAAGGLLTFALLSSRPRAVPAARSVAEATPSSAEAILPGLAMTGAVLLLLLAAAPAAAGELQERIDRAQPGTTLIVRGGVHPGPIVIRGPLRVIGIERPRIDGGGVGSVVRIEGDGVVLSGFEIVNSGREVTQEAAGIKVRGSHHRIEHNVVRDVYFGIHLADGEDNVVAGNEVAPGRDHGARVGHAISLWSVRGGEVVDNRISEARDGIYLSFVERLTIGRNRVVGCRYGIHSMYSKDSRIEANDLEKNLLGAALMYSERLLIRGNRIAGHRLGATAYGLLLKDIGDLRVEGNRFLGNRVGIYADQAPLAEDQVAAVRGNLFAGNETALLLQSTARLTVSGNQLSENLSDVRAAGAGLSPGNRWHEAGLGNYWSSYRGYDRDGDGTGDLPHRVEGLIDSLLSRDPRVQAFLYTPAHRALESSARMFPLLRRAPLLVDEAPLMRPVFGPGAREVRP